MGYSYGGDAHERLFASYQEDSEPLPTGTPMGFPQREHGREEVDILKRLFFPTCWNEVALVRDELAILERLDALGELFDSGIQPYSGGDPSETVESVLDRLPEIRDLLKKDIEAAYKGDPAAKTYMEIIRSYPGFLAVLVQRVAHALYEEGDPSFAEGSFPFRADRPDRRDDRDTTRRGGSGGRRPGGRPGCPRRAP